MPDKKIEPTKAMNIGDARWQLIQWARDADSCLSHLPASKIGEIIEVLVAASFDDGTPFEERECSVGLTTHFPNGDALQKIHQLDSEIGRIVVRVEQEGKYQPADLSAIQERLAKICELEAQSSVNESSIRVF